MSDIFPKWTNKLPGQVILGAIIVGSTVAVGVTYYCTPKYTRVGYQPIQPVAFSHAIHADQIGLDCRYCHNGVEKSWYSNIPSASTCMNCHNQILANDARLALVRESYNTGKAIPWVQVHKTPDYVYFNHSVHVNRGVSCFHCHGEIHKMEEVRHAQPLSMGFCLQCHRNPENFIRPPEQVFNLNWQTNAAAQKQLGEKFVHDWKVNSSQNCSACHR
ncbi:MAG: cytochrome c family protein [Verrucomicrobiales bacterium]|nr:cytochrome c family protein [Verrucomicrobiales bacterium]